MCLGHSTVVYVYLPIMGGPAWSLLILSEASCRGIEGIYSHPESDFRDASFDSVHCSPTAPHRTRTTALASWLIGIIWRHSGHMSWRPSMLIGIRASDLTNLLVSAPRGGLASPSGVIPGPPGLFFCREVVWAIMILGCWLEIAETLPNAIGIISPVQAK
ncbi:hypothetical protein BS47DRAFT_1164754 [Hydnum rufescens UP504]|uniref:Uncharacterized protein n=1 Tax=Hydnum rufescens UP504 TaxID=1448309 RepID=A0A9P6ATB1_9AGAM|nr:hypothetical protein BS47DRAFT_1164754 [Hydnum rufescens UP504]